MKTEYFKIIKKIKNVDIKSIDLVWFLLFPILNINYIVAANIVESGKNIELGFDRLIPFESIFIIPYIYWYIFITIGLIYILYKSRSEYIKVFIAITIGMSCCYVIYYIFPTQIIRPVVDKSNILNKLVNIIYLKDKPFNCFPSIHVLNTYFIMRYTKFEYNKKYFYYTQTVGVLIILSTVFIKQHFVLDIIASIILCEEIIFLINKIKNESLNKILDLPLRIKNRFDKNNEITY
ncbi:phosphatase PAP2 family protein [Clostridium gasigenes]|uniref:PAP2 superfamily protein n=1 Tax=Clostridium gasigenes TaxID=94869 RepID=A0A1H0NAM1_9CLOT|nr:phosphatase PAP2 family protein [Clostridium gasigenes]MBB6623878.1 phosphatase PAP2 family protein [Clostridium gasigenes]MBU3103040.1 phosphatase PAP2 family protein [Clostridium gasigenes]MBU3106673.1 phosphatase PAP2 family protein [Clostridium gasigenes]MBU3135114.1 phosphatase PAP2 family protein [Clostridium gasigenes]NKF05400.1 phosphatase PAP2 family protein [Clostridium gasigenes]